MKKIASHDGIEIFAPDNSCFSFLKSPYAAHRTNSAVDIYYGSFGSDAFSPVDGKIIDIRDFDTPTPFKNLNSKEYLIAIEQGNHVIKILHVKPDVSIGDLIFTGDRIGTFIRNGYFIFWNDPVMHVEVREPYDYLRASNHLNLTPAIEWDELNSNKTVEFDCNVIEVNKRYSLLLAHSVSCSEIHGFSIDGGFIDGYLSSDRDDFFGIIKESGFFRPEAMELEIRSNGSVIKCSGIAFRLSFYEPKIKVIPDRYGEKLLSEGDKVHIKISILH